ncbi:Glyoxalase-like domain protein [Aquisphaera giovannonii]|uniref:Glyoxalase-like domain protein n=1 Tax=Aquisphaera giovannonii TaxID=406548 RepID=A0A5B9WDC3_9BACT|nr:VOC family protein [Aquisphaera giovannonii]QEH37880.1 Glyoxalase-like domain protein [Aquisphaera giovannonii]
MARIEHFAIFAQDAPALKDFYVRTMGMTVALESGGSPSGFFLADEDGVALEIIGLPAGSAVANTRWVCHVAFLVDDVAARRKELEGQGLVFETGTEVDTPTMKTAFFNDPEGNRCQIVWRSKPLVP